MRSFVRSDIVFFIFHVELVRWFHLIYLEQRFHELAREYDTVRSEVVKQREIESQLRSENEQIRKLCICKVHYTMTFFLW